MFPRKREHDFTKGKCEMARLKARIAAGIVLLWVLQRQPQFLIAFAQEADSLTDGAFPGGFRMLRQARPYAEPP